MTCEGHRRKAYCERRSTAFEAAASVPTGASAYWNWEAEVGFGQRVPALVDKVLERKGSKVFRTDHDGRS